jgi:hypothetical protein
VEFIAITGMHRSGTSLVARIVNLLGADIGPEDELMPPKDDNPRGFWEHMPIAQLNDDLLGTLGGRWSDPPVLADGWQQQRRLEPYRRRAAAIVERGFAGEVAMFKDPRASILLPFWRSVASIRRTVVCLRDPAAVAVSLQRRDRMAASRSAGLFVRYTTDAWLDGVDPVAVAFEDVLGDPVGEAERLAEALGLEAPAGAVRDEIAGFVDGGRVRARTRGRAVGVEMSEAIEVDALLRAADRRSITLALGAIRGRTRAESALQDGRARLRRVRRELAGTALQRDEFMADRDRALSLLDDERRALGVAEEKLRVTATQRDELIDDRDRALSLLDDERRAHRVVAETVQVAEEARAVMGARLEGVRRRLEATTARYERLQGVYGRTLRGRVGRIARRWRKRKGRR